MLTKLAHLPRLELNTGISNMHKALTNLPTIANRVCLNTTKIMLLHAISLYFLDRIKYHAPLDTANLIAPAIKYITEMRTHYNEAQNVFTGDRLSSDTVPKLKSNSWPEFKSAITKILLRTTGRNNIPLSYVIHDDATGGFEESYDSPEERLVSCITQRGPAYEADNSDVFSLLLQHTKGKKRDIA